MHRIEAYIRLAVIFVIIMFILYLPIYFILKKRKIPFIRQLSYLGLFYSIFIIIFATILFVPIDLQPKVYVLNLNPFNWTNSNQFIIEKIPNIMLFIPFGLFVPVVFKNMRKFYKVLLISFTFTFSIEFIQYFIGRSSDIVDVLTNLFGGVIGYGLFIICNKLFEEKLLWNKFLGNNYR